MSPDGSVKYPRTLVPVVQGTRPRCVGQTSRHQPFRENHEKKDFIGKESIFHDANTNPIPSDPNFSQPVQVHCIIESEGTESFFVIIPRVNV